MADNKDIIENALPAESNVIVDEAGPTKESSEPTVVESDAVEENEAVIDDSKIDSGLERTQNIETKHEQIDLTESDPVIPTEDSENDVEGDQLKDHLHENVDKQLDVQAEATEAVLERDQLKDQLHDIQNQHEQNAQHNHEHTHEGHSHENTHEGHSHEHNHHDHGHHHGHSHGHHHDDHHHGHSHSHGLDHLGHGVHQRVPEEVPDHYKPAEQKFDLPLSAQFAQSSQYQETTPSTINYHESTQLTNDESNTVVTPNPLEGMDHIEAATPSANDQEDNDEHASTPAFNTTPSTASEDATFTNTLEDEQKASEEADESGLFTTLSNMFASSTEHAVVEEVTQEPIAAEENVKEGVSTESIGNDDILGDKTPDNEIVENVDTNDATSTGETDAEAPVSLKEEAGNHEAQSEAYQEDKAEEQNLDINVKESIEEATEQVPIPEEVAAPEEATAQEEIVTEDQVQKLDPISDETIEETTDKPLEGAAVQNVEDLGNEVTTEPSTVDYQDYNDSNEQIEDSEEQMDDSKEQIQDDQYYYYDDPSEADSQQQDDQLETDSQQLDDQGQGQSQENQHEDQFHQDHKQDDEQPHGHSHHQDEDSIIPDWLAMLLHEHAVIDGDRLVLVGIISVTLLVIHLINSVFNKSSREQPLIKKLSDLDRKLFAATNELLILKKEQAESVGSVIDGGVGIDQQALREVELQLQQTNVELENSRETLRQESDRTIRILGELEVSKKEVVTAQEEARVAQEMVEEARVAQE